MKKQAIPGFTSMVYNNLRSHESKILSYKKRELAILNLKQRLRALYDSKIVYYEKLKKPVVIQTTKRRVLRKKRKRFWRQKIFQMFRTRVLTKKLKKKRHLKKFRPKSSRKVHRVYIDIENKQRSFWLKALNVVSKYQTKNKKFFGLAYRKGVFRRGFFKGGEYHDPFFTLLKIKKARSARHKRRWKLLSGIRKERGKILKRVLNEISVKKVLDFFLHRTFFDGNKKIVKDVLKKQAFGSVRQSSYLGVINYFEKNSSISKLYQMGDNTPNYQKKVMNLQKFMLLLLAVMSRFVKPSIAPMRRRKIDFKVNSQTGKPIITSLKGLAIQLALGRKVSRSQSGMLAYCPAHLKPRHRSKLYPFDKLY